VQTDKPPPEAKKRDPWRWAMPLLLQTNAYNPSFKFSFRRNILEEASKIKDIGEWLNVVI
jgi:hypothetical protein